MSAQDKVSTANALLSEAFEQLNDELTHETSRRRGALAQECWDLRLKTGELREYFSQSGQDWYVDQILLCQKRNGVFVDVGGYDGATNSNSLFFEVFRGWDGVVVEALPDNCARARAVRRCACVEAVVSGDQGEHAFLSVEEGYLQMSGRVDTYDPGILERLRANPRHRESVTMRPSRTLPDILSELEISHIDYLSLDIEGSELEVLRSFPFDRFSVLALSIENHSGTQEIHEIMTAAGFRLVEFLGYDEIYFRSDAFAELSAANPPD